MIGISENVFINTKNRSHSITAEVEIPGPSANGAILAQSVPRGRPRHHKAGGYISKEGPIRKHESRPVCRNSFSNRSSI